jgi:hypothetical protein
MMKKDKKTNFKGCAPMSIGLNLKFEVKFWVSKPKVQNCVNMEV